MEPVVNMRETSGNFINHVISNLIFPLENQEHIMINGRVDWCLDWWVIELGKYFFEGEEAYMRYPIARRLEGHKNFDKELIKKACRNRIAVMDKLIKSSVDILVVYENCRGFNTVLAKTVKNWKKIYVRIQNEFSVVEEKTVQYLYHKHNEVELIPKNGAVPVDTYDSMSVDGFEGGA